MSPAIDHSNKWLDLLGIGGSLLLLAATARLLLGRALGLAAALGTALLGGAALLTLAGRTAAASLGGHD